MKGNLDIGHSHAIVSLKSFIEKNLELNPFVWTIHPSTLPTEEGTFQWTLSRGSEFPGIGAAGQPQASLTGAGPALES